MADKELEDFDFNQGDEVEIPDDAGPALAGRTPLIGSIRRSQDLPVLRDELKDEL